VGLLKRWKERREAKRSLERALREQERDRVEREGEVKLEAKRRAMEEQPCAVRNWERCSRECVHFNPGRGYASSYYAESLAFYYIVAQSPGCRLWGNE